MDTFFEYFILLLSLAAGILLGRSLALHRRKKKHQEHLAIDNGDSNI
ncbi:MAG: hypothetical protein Q7S11_02015 [bacterium]|nr:hypothetical protein [bacterium]